MHSVQTERGLDKAALTGQCGWGRDAGAMVGKGVEGKARALQAEGERNEPEIFGPFGYSFHFALSIQGKKHSVYERKIVLTWSGPKMID